MSESRPVQRPLIVIDGKPYQYRDARVIIPIPGVPVTVDGEKLYFDYPLSKMYGISLTTSGYDKLYFGPLSMKTLSRRSGRPLLVFSGKD